jgi:hypothetical protein
MNILPLVGWVGVASIVLFKLRKKTATAVARGSDYDATRSPVAVPR